MEDIGKQLKMENIGDQQAILVLDRLIIYIELILKQDSKPLTLFIPGPFGLRKGPRGQNMEYRF